MVGRRSRREFLGLFGAAALAPAFRMREASGVNRPNILVIFTDDQPVAATREIPTAPGVQAMPNLHRVLRQRGFEFTRAYNTTPKCGPNRANLQMGVHPKRHRVFSNKGASERFRRVLDSEGRRLPPRALGARLNAQGYRCGFFGRWEVDYHETPAWVAPGYERWAASVHPKSLPVKINVDGRVKTFDWPRKDETAWFFGHASRWIQKPDARPWFALVCPNSPHDPYFPSDASAGSFAGVPMPKGPSFNLHDPKKPAYVRDDPALTDLQVSQMERQWRGKHEEIRDVDLGLAALDRVIDWETTYVFFTSDNGFLFGEFRQTHKASPYEASSRAPLFVRGPGVRAGASSDALATTVDVTATVYELAGLDPEDLDGRSLLPPMVSEEPFAWRDSLLLTQPPDEHGFSDVPGWQAVRTDSHVYVEYETGERELYDMRTDPDQLNNLDGDPAALEGFSQKLAGMARRSGPALREAEKA